ncbi:hypothetical protein [Rufibacter aurantiacus]|uniref:hypothetical protein n=1 Tax=Rufibacter aurantiacus TaxID=2817374 RepID=UPI001B30072E|nr:hypothetical protein [Rufibacter aurantiacus]
MKTSSLVYALSALLAVIGAVLRITHVLNRPYFYGLIGVCIVLGTIGNVMRHKDLNRK